jgi:hypothetical protein
VWGSGQGEHRSTPLCQAWTTGAQAPAWTA